MAKEAVNSGIGHNIIAQGTKIVGTITTTSDIRIDGGMPKLIENLELEELLVKPML